MQRLYNLTENLIYNCYIIFAPRRFLLITISPSLSSKVFKQIVLNINDMHRYITFLHRKIPTKLFLAKWNTC